MHSVEIFIYILRNFLRINKASLSVNFAIYHRCVFNASVSLRRLFWLSLSISTNRFFFTNTGVTILLFCIFIHSHHLSSPPSRSSRNNKDFTIFMLTWCARNANYLSYAMWLLISILLLFFFHIVCVLACICHVLNWDWGEMKRSLKFDRCSNTISSLKRVFSHS